MTSRLAFLLGAGALLPLAACAPDLGNAPAPRSAASLAAVRTIPSENGAWPGDGWWQRYNDPQLNALIAEGLAGSPDIATAAARLARAEGLARAAGGDTLPRLSGSATGTAIRQLESHGLPEEFNLSGTPLIGATMLRGGFDLDLWGKNRAKLRAVLRDRDAARVEAAEARITLAAAIAQSYADLARLYAARDITDQALRIQMDTAGLVADRVRNGLDTRGQQRQAAALVPAARADLASIDEEIAIGRNMLAALLGAGPDRGLTIERPKLAGLAPLALPASAGIDLVGRRPDIVAARARVEAAGERIKAAKAAFYPDISLSALLGFQALSIPNLASGNIAFATAGPAISLPIFDGGKRDGDYRVSRADYDAAVADYDRTLIQALRQVADAIASRNALAAQAKEIRASLADSEEAYRIARLRYRGGLSTYLDVLTAEQGVITARRRDADLSARAFTLDVALVRALGGGFAAA
jgi:NodT family efflux transporter outer membrane factor (OMF) lipoprotein